MFPSPKADTTPSYSARDRGKLARLRCARAPRYGGVGWRRDDKRSAASVDYSYRVSGCREVVREVLRDSTDSGGGVEALFAVLVKAVAGLDLGTQGGEVVVPRAPSGVAHPSSSCAVVLIEVAADFDAQLDSISEVPQGSIRFSPDGTASTCCMGRETRRNRRRLCPDSLGSAEEEHASLSLPVAKARSVKEAGKRPAPSGIALLPPKRQRQAEFQATVLANVEDFAGRLATLEVSGGCFCLQCWEFLLSRAQRDTRLALCLQPASVAFVSRSSQLAQS